MKKFYSSLGEYVEKEFGVTEFYYRDKRIVKIADNVWLAA